MRILFVAMAHSIHTARWIAQISSQGWEIHVFDMMEGTVNPELTGVSTYTVHPPRRGHKGLIDWKSDYPLRRFAGAAKRYLPPSLRARLFPSRIRSLTGLLPLINPDILHSLEMQNESYPLLEVHNRLGGFQMPWIYSCWGSDLYFFKDQEEEIPRIKSVLASCNYFVPDCMRDVALSRELGFRGEIPGVFPGAGSFDVQALRQVSLITEPSSRKSIALKGYQNWNGRALVALEALRTCRDLLEGYTIEVYSAPPAVVAAVREFTASTGIPTKVHEYTVNADILKIFARSRVGLAMSITDGSPNSLIEEMIMGAFPIQSDTVSTQEWICDGLNGFLVPPEDAQTTGLALRKALTDDQLVDRAADINLSRMMNTVDVSVLRPKIIKMYENIYARTMRSSSRQ
jgi:hypothetical protein